MAGSSATRQRHFVGLAIGGILLLFPSCSSTAANRGYYPLATPAGMSPWPAGVPTSVWRPFHLPTVAAGQRCPVTGPPKELSSVFGPGVGDGPVYAVSGGTIAFEYPPPANSQFGGSQWGGQKVLWVGRRSYAGPVLIRGHQLDGANEVRFEDDVLPANYVVFESSGGVANWDSDFHEWPSHVRLRASGCYAWQVDGSNFSEVIVFRARATAPVG